MILFTNQYNDIGCVGLTLMIIIKILFVNFNGQSGFIIIEWMDNIQLYLHLVNLNFQFRHVISNNNKISVCNEDNKKKINIFNILISSFMLLSLLFHLGKCAIYRYQNIRRDFHQQNRFHCLLAHVVSCNL